MIRSAAHTDRGLRRSNNQDCFLLDEANNLYLLADGMGGHRAGDTAARMAVESVHDFVGLACQEEITWPFGYDETLDHAHNVLQNGMQIANLRVCRASEDNEAYAGMGSTLLGVWTEGNRARFCHVGDSRLYLLRQGVLSLLTEDHSLVQEQVKTGLITAQQARVHPHRNVVTRAIGIPGRLELDAQEVQLESKDLLLLCSDGLSDLLDDDEIRGVIGPELDIEKACSRLVEAANSAGGRDNVTVVLLLYTAQRE